MAESTYDNAIYVDVYGKVCAKNDTNALRKISRQEAVRAGLIPASDAPPPVVDDTIVMHADGGSHRTAGTLGSPAAPQYLGNPEEVRVTNPKEESRRVQGKTVEPAEDDEDEHAEKAVKRAPEDKAVHKSGSK